MGSRINNFDLECDEAQCPLCASHKPKPLQTIKPCFFKCVQCHLVFHSPVMEQSEYIQQMSRQYSRVDPYLAVAASRENLYKDLLKKIEPFKRGDASMLDVGCGWGYFLSLAKSQGWNTTGVEYVPELARKGREGHGLDIVEGDFMEADYREEQFDVVTMWNILDELVDPFGALNKTHKILKKEGHLFLRLPNAQYNLFMCRLHQMFGKVISRNSFIIHLYNFSVKPLERILRQEGFTKIQIRNSRPTSGNPYSVKGPVGLLKALAFALTQVLYWVSFGHFVSAPSIEVIAQKA